MPISEQVLRDLRDIASTITRGMRDSAGERVALNETARQLVFRTLPALLDEVELARREQAVVGDADRVQHLAQDSLLALRDMADGQRPDDVEVPAQQLIDVLDYVAHLQTARVGLRAALKRTNELLVERCSLHDTLLAKDFLALFAYARQVVTATEQRPLDLAIEGLALQLARLAPLQDDVRRALALHQRQDVAILSLPLGDRLARVLRELAPLVGVPFADVALLALVNGTDDLLDRFVADDAVVARLRADVQASVTSNAYPVDPAHTVKVLHADGSTRVECDHTFPGSARCAYCGIPFTALQRLQAAEASSLPFVLRGAVPVPPGQPRRSEVDPSLFDQVVQQQVGKAVAAGFVDPAALDAAVKASSVSRAGSDVFEVTIPPPSLGVEQVEVDSVSIPLGPSLRPRIEALNATGKFSTSRDLLLTVQTLFVLGMLTAEAQEPQAHVGDPMLHVSAEALFVRFGMPHEGGARAAQQRADILRQLFLDLAEWCDSADPLRPTFAAALAALPR